LEKRESIVGNVHPKVGAEVIEVTECLLEKCSSRDFKIVNTVYLPAVYNKKTSNALGGYG
jgi:hypothetical protein